MSTRRNSESPKKVSSEMSTPLRRSSRPSKRKLTKAESSELEGTQLSPRAKQSHVEKMPLASDTSNKKEKGMRECLSPEPGSPKLQFSVSLLPPKASKGHDVTGRTNALPVEGKGSPKKGKSKVAVSDNLPKNESESNAAKDNVDSKSTPGRQTRNAKAHTSPSETLSLKPSAGLSHKKSGDILVDPKPKISLPLRSSKRGKTSDENSPLKVDHNSSDLKKSEISVDAVMHQTPSSTVKKSPGRQPGAKHDTATSPVRSTRSHSSAEILSVSEKLPKVVTVPLNNQPILDSQPNPVIVESVIPEKPVLTEAMQAESLAPQLFQKQMGDSKITKAFGTQADLGDDLSIDSSLVAENVETCSSEDSNHNETFLNNLENSAAKKTNVTIEGHFNDGGDTDPSEATQGSQPETLAQIRRKRVASELLQAAEIAHGMLGNKPRNKAISFQNTVGKNQTKKVGDCLESPVQATPPSSVTDRTFTDMMIAASSTEDSEGTSDMKTKATHEKSIDEIFESTTAIVKASLISNNKIKDYLLNEVPLLTGVSAVVSPSSHFLLHGSWLSIIRARKCLEQFARDVPEPRERTLATQKTTTKRGRQYLPVKMPVKSNNNKAVVSQEDSLPINIPVKSNNKKDVVSQVGISMLSVDSIEPSADEEEKLQIVEDVDFEFEIDGVKEELVGGRVKGLDRNKLQGSVEVYVEPKTGDRTYLCNMCGFSNFDYQTVQTHIWDNHSPHILCKYCNLVFKDKAEIQQHVKEVHNAVQTHVCVLCGKKFANKRYLMTHLRRHSGIRNHQCDICGRKFFEAHKLRWHMETHKPAAEKKLPYSCSICSKKFYNRSSLSDHQNIHTGARPFECDMCDASFSHRIGLKRHLLTHSSERPFQCNICDKAFKTYKQLESHEVQHTGQSVHSCTRCGKVFSTQYSLKRHFAVCEKRDIGSEMTDAIEQTEAVLETVTVDGEATHVEETVFMCGVCDKLFSSLEEAADHARTHTSGDVQIEVETSAQDLDAEQFTIATTTSATATDVLVSCEDHVETEDDTAAKLFNAMTSQQVAIDDTHLVANTLADLSALGQSPV